MKPMIQTASLMIAAAVTVTPPAPPAAADSFSIHVGGGHVAMHVGVGDWGAYRDSWYDPHWSISYDSALAGYGEWIWVDGLGRVWRPWVNAGWRPYTFGRWVYTDLGWTWVSYEPWGYIPHHYGEWALTVHGWAWVPGYQYRPAHVVWVRTGAYLGWYACPPRGWSHHHRGHWYAGHRQYDRGYRHGYDDGYWDGWDDARHATYIPWKEMGSDNVANHAVSREGGLTRAEVRRLSAAPTRDDVSRRGGPVVRQVALDRRTVKMGGREVTMARPRGMSDSVERNSGDTVRRALAPTVSRRLAQPDAGSTPAEPKSTRRPAGTTVQERAPSRSDPPPRADRSQASGRDRSPAAAPPARDAGLTGRAGVPTDRQASRSRSLTAGSGAATSAAAREPSGRSAGRSSSARIQARPPSAAAVSTSRSSRATEVDDASRSGQRQETAARPTATSSRPPTERSKDSSETARSQRRNRSSSRR